MADSTVIYTRLYPRLEKALSQSNNVAKLKEFYNEVISRNNEALSDTIPSKTVFVDRRVEAKFYQAIDIQPEEVMQALKASDYVGDNWHTVQNPMYVLLVLLIIYFNNKKKTDMVNLSMLICSIYAYKNVRSKYFRQTSEKTINCMKATIDRLSYKNDFKKCGSILKTLMKKGESFLNNWLVERKKETVGVEVTDKTICDMVNRNHRDYAKLLNNFYAEFRKDFDAGNYSNVDKDIDTEDEYIESDNVSFMVEKNTQKVMNKFILSTYPNGKIMQQVCERENDCSINNLRNMLHYIYDDHERDFEKLVRVIIQVYLFDKKKKIEDLKTFDFEKEMREYYKGQAIGDKNLQELKEIVDKIFKNSNIKTTRSATINACKRAFYLYTVIYIRYSLIG